MALRSVSVLQVRCGVCRRNSWRSDVQHQGKAALVGRLHIYHDNPIQGFDRIQVNGFEINDGFYASYESFFRMDGYGFQRAVNEAQREGKPKPHRTVPEDFRTSRGLGGQSARTAGRQGTSRPLPPRSSHRRAKVLASKGSLQ